MDIDQTTKSFLENDFRFMTIGEIAKELVSSKATIAGLNSQVEDLQSKLTASMNDNKELKNKTRELEQELAKK